MVGEPAAWARRAPAAMKLRQQTTAKTPWHKVRAARDSGRILFVMDTLDVAATNGSEIGTGRSFERKFDVMMAGRNTDAAKQNICS